MEVEVADARPIVVIVVVEHAERVEHGHQLGPQGGIGHVNSSSVRRRGTRVGRPLTLVPLHCSCSAANRPARPSTSSGLEVVTTCSNDGPSIRSRITPPRPATVTVPWARATGSPASATKRSTVASKADRPFHSGRSSLST